VGNLKGIEMFEIEISCTPSDAPKMRVFADKDRDAARAIALKTYQERGWPEPTQCYVIVRRTTFEYWMPVTKGAK
jgi:hypothetical protein